MVERQETIISVLIMGLLKTHTGQETCPQQSFILTTNLFNCKMAQQPRFPIAKIFILS